MAKRIRYTLTILAAFLFIGFAPILQAAPGGIGGPKIIAAVPDYDLDVLIIFGTGLHDGVTRPTVTIAGVERKVSVTEDGEVLVHGLMLISPGDYLLVLRPDHRVNVKAEIMVTLGAVGPAGPAGPAGPLPSPYSVDSGYFLVDEAVQQAAVSISCHPEDIAVGGMWFAYPTETTFFSGGGSSWNGYHATLNNSESEFSVRVIVSCLDFSEPLHSGSRDSAICDYDASDPGDYRCSPADH